MTWATVLLASCAVDVPDCENTPASVLELPLLFAVLAVLLVIGVASALGLRDRPRGDPSARSALGRRAGSGLRRRNRQ